MVTIPSFVVDLEEEDSVVLDESPAFKSPQQSLEDKLRSLEMNNLNLEMAIREKGDFLVLMRAQHLQSLRNKEIEYNKIVGSLQDQLDEARGELYGEQSQNSSPEPEIPDEPEHSQLEKNFSEQPKLDILSEATDMAYQKKYQKALILLDTNILATDSTAIHTNAMLLKSSILRLCDEPKRGLEFAEQVVYIASLNHLPKALAAAQVYRGLCLHDLGLYADALRCYVRGSSIRWNARNVTHLTAAAEEKRNALPSGSRGKELSSDFQEIPLSTLATGFGFSPVSL